MTNKELHRLKRSELLELMLAQSKEIDRLKKQLEIAERKLQSRDIVMEKTGSIAEAALVLNRIFSNAQRAADLYLDNVERICRERAVENGAEEEWNDFSEKVKQSVQERKGESGNE